MKLKKTPLLIITVRYGLIAGVLITLLLIAIYYIGEDHPLMIPPYLDFRILLLGILIFFGLKEFRDGYNESVLYFWQGIIGSYIILFIASVVGALGLMTFAHIEPKFVSTYIEQRMAYWQSFTDEEINKIGKNVFDYNVKHFASVDALQLAFSYFAQGIIMGLFISIILSVILRKQPKTL